MVYFYLLALAAGNVLAIRMAMYYRFEEKSFIPFMVYGFTGFMIGGSVNDVITYLGIPFGIDLLVYLGLLAVLYFFIEYVLKRYAYKKTAK